MKKMLLALPAVGMLFAIGFSFVTPLYAQTKEPIVTVMSYNIYRGGTMSRQPLSQTAKVIQEAKADIVGVQETLSPKGDNAEKNEEEHSRRRRRRTSFVTLPFKYQSKSII